MADDIIKSAGALAELAQGCETSGKLVAAAELYDQDLIRVIEATSGILFQFII